MLYCFLLAEGNASEGLYGAVAKYAEGIRHVHLVEREEAARVVDERRVGLAAAAREIEHAELALQPLGQQTHETAPPVQLADLDEHWLAVLDLLLKPRRLNPAVAVPQAPVAHAHRVHHAVTIKPMVTAAGCEARVRACPHEDAIADCNSALSINPKCTKTITEKGKALLGLGRFDEARQCYESIRPLDGNIAADNLLKKVDDSW